MKTEIQKETLAERIAHHPLLQSLSKLVLELYKLQFVVIFPDEEGWHQIHPTEARNLPDYCRLIQSSKDGAKHCRMCHVLMSVAACSEARSEQQCHAAATVLTTTCKEGGCGGLAVLSSCIFRNASTLKAVRARAKKLGLDVRQVEKAFRALPDLSPRDRELARQALQTCAEAAALVREADRQALQIRHLKGEVNAPSPIESILKARLRGLAPAATSDGKTPADNSAPSSMLIRILVQLIDEHPELPFTEKDVAAAARTTPNYLSALFRRHVGQCFSDYVGEKRLTLAKKLLQDLTMNIGEVSRKAGYEDPGYFARRFRQKTGLSPRDWRLRRLAPRK